MKTTTRFRLLGIVAVLAVAAAICWQLLPETTAQKKEKSIIQPSAGSFEGMKRSDNFDAVLLNARQIDVKSPEVQAERNGVGSFEGKRLHIVRFSGPIQGAWVKMLKKSGLEVVDYIPHYSYLVYGDAPSIQRIQTESRNAASPIIWEGPYKSEYRIMPSVYVSPRKDGTGKLLRSDQFEIQLIHDAKSNDETLNLVKSLQKADIRGLQQVRQFVNFVVGLDEDGMRQIAERPDVISIYPYIAPQKFDERQDLILRAGGNPTPADYLSYLAGKGFSQAQFDASNFVVDVSDSGIGNADPANENQFLLRRLGDPADVSRVAYSRLEGTPHTGSTLAGCDGHGNLNSTIIAGYVPSGGIFGAAPHADASGYRYGLGIAPFVKVGSSVIFDPDTFTNPNIPNLQSKAYNDGARISSNSWGSSAGGAYTTTSQTYDALVRDAQPAGSTFPTAGNQEMVIVFSAGNSGPGANTMGAPGTSKNLITVGASENVHPFGGADLCGIDDTGADNSLDMISFSSRGPTDDGRAKPDINLPGTHVTGGVAQNVQANPVTGTGTQLTCFDASGVCAGVGSNFFPAGQQWYTASSGTSHSAPAISGYAALIRQYFINNAPLGVTGGSGTPPSPALTKAMMMNTATYMTGVGANDDLPSNSQGMGLASLDSFFDLIDHSKILRDQNPADTFTDTGQQRIYTGTVADNSKPFRVTLAFSDTPGSTTGDAFVNDLDLEVVVGGVTYKGNVFDHGNSIAGGTADIRNNVESVFVPAGVTGNFVIKVKATNIAGDGVPGDADTTDQDYALVAWNAAEAPLPVISGGATQITAESCAINGAIDPAETVTINFELANVGTQNTNDLVATLQATGGVTGPSGPQSYGALTAGGSSVTKAFTFTAGTNCGETLTATFQLQDGMADLGNVTFTFSTGALGAPGPLTVGTGDIATAIPDSGSVDIPINVATTGVVGDMNVAVRLNHTFDGDVQMSLISPNGTMVPLATNRGGSGDNYGTGSNDCSGTPTVFDDAAASAISSGTAPFAGSFRPESVLSAFNGEPVSGTWILRVADTANLDTGTVGCVQLQMQRQRYVCCGIPGTPEISKGGPAALISESFNPPNSTPDPGETVSFDFPFINSGDGDTTNLVATLQNSGGVTPITTSQNYGVLAAGGSASARTFSFVATGNCGDMITATIHMQDGALDLGDFTYTFRLGTINNVDQTFSNNGAISIPSSGSSTPYPSTIDVSGAPTSFSAVKVSLNGISHTFPSDIDVLLVSPAGQKFILMSDAIGGTDFAGQSYTFDDAAATIFPGSGSPPPDGSYRPANYGTGDTFGAPAPAGPYLSPATAGADTLTSAFTSSDPNGTWSLYVVDDAGGDSGNIAGGWSLTFTVSTNVCSTGPTGPAVRADYDGDQKTDLSVYRPSDGNWYVYGSQLGFLAANWGISGDIPMAGDFDGDGETDLIVRRHIGNGVDPDIHVLRTSNFTYEGISWGVATDSILIGDYDGDGKDEVAAFRPSEGYWYIRDEFPPLSYRAVSWGGVGDIPMSGDFDGDHKTDLAVFRPSDGYWYIAHLNGSVISNTTIIAWGLGTDKLVPADYDGDGKDDIAVYRPSDGYWYIRESHDGSARFTAWGLSTDTPIPGDYDGDGHYDVAVFRNGDWYILGSQNGFMAGSWGLSTDVPVPSKYIP